jgi:hypothetical protein
MKNLLLHVIWPRFRCPRAFFDREYRRPDKEEIKARIISVLKNAPVYK